MNEETTHPGTGACLLQNVYSVNYYPNTGDSLRENTLTNPVNIKNDTVCLDFQIVLFLSSSALSDITATLL